MVKNILITILAVITLLLLLSLLGKNKEIGNLTLKLGKADSIGLVNNRIVYQKDVEITNYQSQIRDLTDSLFSTSKKHDKQIKEVHAFYAGKTTTIITDKVVPYLDVPAMKKWQDSIAKNCRDVISYYDENTVPLNTKMSLEDPHFSFKATINKKSLSIDSLIIKDTQYIRFVTFKGGLLKRENGKLKIWKKKRLKVEVTHTNPYIINEGVSAAFYQKPPSNSFLKGAVIGGGIVYILTLAL